MDIIRKFNSILDWLNYAENPHPNDGPDRERESFTCNMKWNGVTSRNQGFDLLRSGWPEGLANMRKVLDCCRNLVSIESPQYQFHDAIEGSAPNIEAYLHGIPEDMHHMEEVQMDAPPSYLSIQCDMTVSSWTSTTQLTWAGAVLFAAMEALKAQGCATALTMSHSTAQGEHHYSAYFPVPSDLDMDSVAYLFTHPAALRVIFFSVAEHETKEIRGVYGFRVGRGYGRPTPFRAEGVDGMLSIAHMANMFGDTPAANIDTARKMLQSLVDTKFESYTSKTLK